MKTKLSITTAVSVLIHLVFIGAVMRGHRPDVAPASPVLAQPELLAGQTAALPVIDAVPVELEHATPPVTPQPVPLSPGESVNNARASSQDPKPVRPQAPALLTQRGNESNEAKGVATERSREITTPREGSLGRSARRGRAANDQATPAIVDHDAVGVRTPRAPISGGALREAMQAAAASSASSGAAVTVPIVRVDPRESNLDRAWARAFAWAFATDRSFFSATPVGKARFILQLNDSGAIADVFWSEPRPSPRIKELVLRMVRLLSQNRFLAPIPESGSPPRRGFEMIVTESHVEVPKPISASASQEGDLWALEAGETPTLARPSHPSVVDITGRKVSCSLRILEPLPNSR